ncbi:tetratricopeptide repeat protein [Thalassotalea sp. ND16A]|uniref:tetratricopeptide repeat protein n=1 Tax=Thalassotalea sp. ND16A TaxID=1535422 RepID=UPI00051D0AE0|nr:tetratricopeptide repeat protein [Thalassotalea sp. ND16A]KGJ97141.1 hypothetical protein ND16A_0063 [Thalassotalea sp. ND16A]
MKFINLCCTPTTLVTLRVETLRRAPKGVIALALALMIAGCSTSPEVVELPGAAEPQVGEHVQAGAGKTVDAKTVDPKAAERQRLLALPNLYKQGAVPVPAVIKASVNAALALKADGDIAGATARLTAISAANRSLSGVALHLGDIALESGDIEQATRYYQQATHANSNNYFAYNRLGSVYRRQGQFMQAKASYQAALASWGGFAEAHLNLGILLDIYLGEKQQALAYYQSYQLLTDEKNRKVKGWIADISMQLRAVDNG